MFGPGPWRPAAAPPHRGPNLNHARRGAVGRGAASPAADEDEDGGVAADEGFGDEGGALYQPLRTAALSQLETREGWRQHPDKIAECTSLFSVQSPQSTWVTQLPATVKQGGHLSSLQFQTVQLCCDRHEKRLTSGCRAGFFLGDGPGVGKGRQVAAVLWENFIRGRTKALWFSASADLAVDAERDLHDIGALSGPGKIPALHNLKDYTRGEKLCMQSGVLFCTYARLISGSKSITEGGRDEGQEGEQPGRRLGLNPDECDQEEGEEEEHDRGAAAGQRAAGGPAGADEEQDAGMFGPESRLQQIVAWLGRDFDGVIAFDEGHRAKSCVNVTEPHTGKQVIKKSKTAAAVIELQRLLPEARVMYVSATGATEPENLIYATRLGLWGSESPFSDPHELVKVLRKGDVGAMELVAMEIKQAGSYIARTLSYEGIVFEQLRVQVPPAFIQMYNKAVALWTDTLALLKELKETDGLLRDWKVVIGQYWGAHQRFFRQLCTSAKVPAVVKRAKEELRKGNCVVIGLQSTGEARSAAFVEEQGGDEQSLDHLVEPARLILPAFLKCYVVMPPQDLLQRSEQLQLPQNPLDELIEQLGGEEEVSELTGRTKRFVPQDDGTYKYVKRAQSYGSANLLEKKRFMDGEKLVAIISDAASTGISLQADLNVPNQRLRVHLTLELAWSADKTVQQLGRTHRSNQRQPPLYVIVFSDIGGESRFASAVCRRLQQLGALTQGDRNATSAADALAVFNLETAYGKKAMGKLVKVLKGMDNDPPKLPSMNIVPSFILEHPDLAGVPRGSAEYEEAREELLLAFLQRAVAALRSVGFMESGAKNIARLLNRLLGCKVDLQGKVFDYFMALLDAEITEAKREGTFSEHGIIRPSCSVINFVSRKPVFTKGATRSFLTTFRTDRSISWSKALELYQAEKAEDPATTSCFAYNIHNEGHSGGTNRTNMVLALERKSQGQTAVGQGSRRAPRGYRIVRPTLGSAFDISAEDFARKYRRLREAELHTTTRNRWESEYRNKPRPQQDLHLVTGSVLHLLSVIQHVLFTTKVPRVRMVRRMLVMRVESTDPSHTCAVGVYIPNHLLPYVESELQRVQQLGTAVAGAAPGPAAAARGTPAGGQLRKRKPGRPSKPLHTPRSAAAALSAAALQAAAAARAMVAAMPMTAATPFLGTGLGLTMAGGQGHLGSGGLGLHPAGTAAPAAAPSPAAYLSSPSVGTEDLCSDSEVEVVDARRVQGGTGQGGMPAVAAAVPGTLGRARRVETGLRGPHAEGGGMGGRQRRRSEPVRGWQAPSPASRGTWTLGAIEISDSDEEGEGSAGRGAGLSPAAAASPSGAAGGGRAQEEVVVLDDSSAEDEEMPGQGMQQSQQQMTEGQSEQQGEQQTHLRGEEGEQQRQAWQQGEQQQGSADEWQAEVEEMLVEEDSPSERQQSATGSKRRCDLLLPPGGDVPLDAAGKRALGFDGSASKLPRLGPEPGLGRGARVDLAAQDGVGGVQDGCASSSAAAAAAAAEAAGAVAGVQAAEAPSGQQGAAAAGTAAAVPSPGSVAGGVSTDVRWLQERLVHMEHASSLQAEELRESRASQAAMQQQLSAMQAMLLRMEMMMRGQSQAL